MPEFARRIRPTDSETPNNIVNKELPTLKIEAIKMCHFTSPNQATNLFSTIDQRARDSRRLNLWIIVLLATLFLASRANAQNVQYDDKALDLGSRGAARVDPVTRGLSFEIPLGSYPGRAGMNVPITLSYSSKVWNVEFQGYNGGTNPPSPPMQPFTIVVARYAKRSVAGWTSSIGMPIVETAPTTSISLTKLVNPRSATCASSNAGPSIAS